MAISARRRRAATPSGSPVDVLFLGAHPDDIELFAGGTVAKLAAAGYRVALCDLTQGEMGSNGTPQQRRRESERAARQLGVRAPRLQLGLPDGGLDAHDPAQLAALVGLLRRARPRLFCPPLPLDRHPDHEETGRLARRAVFFAGVHGFTASGRAFRPEAVAYYLSSRDAEPTFLIDVSRFMAARRRALDAYASQFRPARGRRPTAINRPGYLDGIEAKKAALGARIDAAYAEGFVLEATPRIDDPVAWLCRRRGGR